MGNLRIGPAGWNYSRDWKRVFYPAKKTTGFSELGYLAEYFDVAEINTSFYGPISVENAAKWVNEVRANERFMFTAKLWQQFTHRLGGNTNDERAVRKGFDALHHAGKLGAVLLQFPFSFHNTQENRAWLGKLFEKFREYPLVLEVRHGSWDVPAAYNYLREYNVGFCNIDQPVIGNSMKPAANLTSRVGYARFHGRRYDTWFSDDPKANPADRYDYLYSLEELKPWVERIRQILSKSEDTFVILNNTPGAKSQQNGLMLASMLTKKKVKVPETMFERYPELRDVASEAPREPKLF